MSKLTQWHSGDVKPVHEGVYEIGDKIPTFQYWNGEFWCVRGDDIKGAINGVMFGKSYFQNYKWRGLAVKP